MRLLRGLRIAIVHASFEVIGGAEYLALNMLKALDAEGAHVALYTLSNIQQINRALQLFGTSYSSILNKIHISHNPIFLPNITRIKFSKFRRLLMSFLLASNVRTYNKDSIIIVETLTSTPLRNVDVVYIHYPSKLEDVNRNEGSKFHLLRTFYTTFVNNIVIDTISSLRPIALTNSSWTAVKTRQAFNLKTEIVYPPIRVKELSSLAANDKREKIVLTVSRLSFEKRVESIVRVASQLPSYEFILVGSMAPDTLQVLKFIENTAKQYRVKNLKILVNIPRHVLEKLMRDAMVYLHPPFAEHFGISVAEAVAAGLIPIVYRDGGAWYDIVKPISFRLGYKSIGEITNIIKTIESNTKLRREIIKRGLNVVKRFEYNKFREKVAKIFSSLSTAI